MNAFGGNGMIKGPTRAAPSAPMFQNRYSPVTNWNDDLFTNDPFEPAPMYAQKKKPPPRPPPPKLQPKVPEKPTHFIRKPTVLSSLLSKKSKLKPSTTVPNEAPPRDTNVAKLFNKCEVRQADTLIDFSTPPSSPTFTTRSSSDGLSIDSFGSDATSSTNNIHVNNGNASQAESGFEDDFDLFLNRKIAKDDTIEDFANFDPFSPPKMTQVKRSDWTEQHCNNSRSVASKVTHNMPTIIRASKPARPKPPDNSALLKTTLSNGNHAVAMSFNVTKPIEKASLSSELYSKPPIFNQIYDTNSHYSWETSSSTLSHYSSSKDTSYAYSSNYPQEYSRSESKAYPRESSPPMPTIPPPPPPQVDESDLPPPEQLEWPAEDDESFSDDEQPHAIALYDFFSDLKEDLSFSANTKIKLVKRLNDEWFEGRLEDGSSGMFPANYVDVRVPLSEDKPTTERPIIGRARALYDLTPTELGDLPLRAGAEILIYQKINEEWYLGESNGHTGQFPANYVHFL